MWNWIASFWHGAAPPFEISLWFLLSLALCIGSVILWRNVNPWQAEPIRNQDWYEQRCHILANRHSINQDEKEKLLEILRKDGIPKRYN